MHYFLRLAIPLATYILVPIALCCAALVWRRRKVVVYRYSLVSSLKAQGLTTRHPFKKILAIFRLITLLTLAFLAGKPQLVDPRSKVEVEGIDMVLVLDVSGSMQHTDFDERSRLDVAKQEALRFIAKRVNDPIGVVVFGKHVISRCPLTLDKTMLRSVIGDLQLGIVDPDGTVLSRALVTAVNRLKQSTATSKVIILLTDGEPSEGDLQPQVALEAAKRYGIKIYTIGIGSEEQRFAMHQLYGLVAIPRVNKELLDILADETGGKSFLAQNPDDMRAIYDTIDQLETTVHETDIFSNYYDIFVPCVWALSVLLLLEQILATFLWFGI